jgi:hypothetical protein
MHAPVRRPAPDRPISAMATRSRLKYPVTPRLNTYPPYPPAHVVQAAMGQPARRRHAAPLCGAEEAVVTDQRHVQFAVAVLVE